MERRSPSRSPRASRPAKSLTEVSAPISLENGAAPGAAERNSFSAPYSSPSKCEPPIHRSLATGMTFPTASAVRPNSLRKPAWNSTGSSSTIRYELNVKPPGITSSGVQMR